MAANKTPGPQQDGSRDELSVVANHAPAGLGALRDWRAEHKEAEDADRVKLRISERDDGLPARTFARIHRSHELVRCPELTAKCEAKKYPELAEYLAQQESKHVDRVRRRERIARSDPFIDWVTRRLVRIARSFQLWLESTHRTYARPQKSGYWATVVFNLIEGAASSERLREAEHDLRVLLGDVLQDAYWLTLHNQEGLENGRTPQYLFSGAVWRDLFRASEGGRESHVQARLQRDENNTPESEDSLSTVADSDAPQPQGKESALRDNPEPTVCSIIQSRLGGDSEQSRRVQSVYQVLQSIPEEWIAASQLPKIGISPATVFCASGTRWRKEVDVKGINTKNRTYRKAKLIEYVLHNWSPKPEKPRRAQD